MASFEQNKDSKLWSVRFRQATPSGEKQKRLSGFKTKREAQSGYVEYCKNYQIDSSPITFRQLCTAYEEYAISRLKVSSYYDVKRKIENHIVPFFAAKNANDIKPIDILAWQQGLEKYSFKYKTGLRGRLCTIFRFGYRYYDIVNPLDKVEPFRNTEPKKEMLCWSKEEFEQFISCVDEPQYKMFFTFLYLSGCRKGEALALTWNDVKTDRVIIRQSITRKVDGKAWAVVTPKNKTSNREITMPENFLKQLGEYHIWQKENCGGDLFVFGSESPLSDNTVTRRLKMYCEKSGAKVIRLHDFRHSLASLLISEGVSIVAVSKRLGHNSIEETLRTYTHLMPSDDARLNNALAKIV